MNDTIFSTDNEVLYQYTFRLLSAEAAAQRIIGKLFTDLWKRPDTLHISTHIRIYLERFVLHAELHSELTFNTIIHKDLIFQLQEDLLQFPAKENHVFTLYHSDQLHQNDTTQLNNACRKAQRMISKLLLFV